MTLNLLLMLLVSTKVDPLAIDLLKTNMVPPIGIPLIIGRSIHDEWIKEDVEVYVKLRLVLTANNGVSFNPFRFGPWWEFLDVRTGKKVKLFANDRFRVRFADGSTVELYFTGISAFSPNLYFQMEMETALNADGTPARITHNPRGGGGGRGTPVTPQPNPGTTWRGGGGTVVNDSSRCVSGVVRYCPVTHGG